MDNVIKCPSCHKTLIGEEEYLHACIFDVIEIPVRHYFEVNKPQADVIVAKGINGKIYRLVKQHNLSTKNEQPSPEVERFKKSPEDEAQPKNGNTLTKNVRKDQPSPPIDDRVVISSETNKKKVYGDRIERETHHEVISMVSP